MALRALPAKVTRRPRHDRRGFEEMTRRSRSRPLLDLFLEGGFVELGSTPPGEFLAGGIARPWQLAGGRPIAVADLGEFVAFAEPGYAKIGFNFTVEPDGSGSLVATETRILATSDDARRSFGRYWVVIRAGSGLIRRSWLAGIRRRAERT